MLMKAVAKATSIIALGTLLAQHGLERK